MNVSLKTPIAASLALAMAACGNVSHQVAKDGASAGELVWPAPESVTPMHKDGTFPNLANLRQVKAGLNKQQVSDLIGYPHFSEGVWGVREWNYVFHFRGSDNGVTTCQYKVLFDEDKLARSFYWKPESCADALKEPAPPAPAVVASEPPRVLSGDALFGFDSAELSAGGRQTLDALADDLNARRNAVKTIRIAGYTDRLGGHSYNQQLSERRARAVKDYLVARNIPADRITARGYGESDPVKECPDQQRDALIACLAPNRRVEVLLR